MNWDLIPSVKPHTSDVMLGSKWRRNWCTLICNWVKLTDDCQPNLFQRMKNRVVTMRSNPDKGEKNFFDWWRGMEEEYWWWSTLESGEPWFAIWNDDKDDLHNWSPQERCKIVGTMMRVGIGGGWLPTYPCNGNQTKWTWLESRKRVIRWALICNWWWYGWLIIITDYQPSWLQEKKGRVLPAIETMPNREENSGWGCFYANLCHVDWFCRIQFSWNVLERPRLASSKRLKN